MKTATTMMALGSFLAVACSGTDSETFGASAEVDPAVGAGETADGPAPATEMDQARLGATRTPQDERSSNTEAAEQVLPEGWTVDGQILESRFDRISNSKYDSLVKDLLGVTDVNGGLPSDMLIDDYQGPMDGIIWNAYQNAAEQIAAQVMAGPEKTNFISCDPAAVATCYEDTIKAFGAKAFRRPLTDDDVVRLLAVTIIEPAGTEDQIAEALLHAFLVSPSFLLETESGVGVEH